MDIHGDLKFSGAEATFGQVVQGGFATETAFPEVPKVGRVVFKDNVLYMCVAFNNTIPIWIPLTNAIDTYLHDQSSASTTWTVNHSLNSAAPLVQVYDEAGSMIIPDSVIPTDNNTLVITVSNAIAGRAIVMSGQRLTGAGVGILTPQIYSFSEDFTSIATIVVRHNLGYFPIVRVFLSTDEEIQPQSITHDSIYQATVVFSSAQTGTIRMV